TAKNYGIRNILALRGDSPIPSAPFPHAIDLVKYIRKTTGDYFSISVAGFPEGHDESSDPVKELQYLKEKVDAGADFIITQLFYNCDKYLEFVKRCKDVGIKIPIIPGICPIQSYGAFQRILKLCPEVVPPKSVLESLEPIKNDDQAVKEYGIELAIEMCSYLMKNGVLEKSIRRILEGLHFVKDSDNSKPFPWISAKTRENETVRPIYWGNRADSYIERTDAWDEFPNGRWGDSRSPAFGEITGLNQKPVLPSIEARKQWGIPTTVANIFEVFVGYVKGIVDGLPWSVGPMSLESEIIRDQLIWCNSNGYLTVNSQPAVDGVASNHRVFGWGPKNGFIYQR
ncbi:hypothetical protein HK096_009650, partial [Nowakowskiella sp. JEL0078]